MSDNASVPGSFMDMPGCQWFWDNYNKCLQWQENHQLAYFKAKVTALQFENDLLHKQILHLAEQNDKLIVQNQSLVNGVNPGFLVDSYSFYGRHEDTGYPRSQVDNYYNSASQYYQYSSEPMNISADSDDEDEDGDDEHLELSEEFIKFVEIGFRHKMEMKKLKEEKAKRNGMIKEHKDGEDGISDKGGDVCDKVPNLHRKEQRKKEMAQLYGEAAPKIHAMETAVQLSFNRNADLFQPILWPHIPLNFIYAESLQK